MKVHKPGYYLTNKIKDLPANQREQVWLLYQFHKSSGWTGRLLVEHYLNHLFPITLESLKEGYSSKTSHRCKRRKKLHYLLENYLYLKKE